MTLSRRAVIASGAMLPFMGGAAQAAYNYHVSPPRYPGPDEGLVYVFRPVMPGAVYRPSPLSIDGRKFISLESGDYSWLYIKPGVHDFALMLREGVWRQHILNIQPEIQGARITYLRFTPVWEGDWVTASFEEVEKREAVAGMRYTWYRKPEPGWVAAP